MKKEIVQKGDGVVTITTIDERWYSRQETNEKTGEPEYKFYPSSSWISSYWPKGIGFYKWLASKGWNEAEAVKQQAGVRGLKVHYAIEDLVNGKEVAMEDKYMNPETEKEEELTLEEYKALMTFVDWYEQAGIEKVYATELTGFNAQEGYAGTTDLICRREDGIWLIDYKTSSRVYPSHKAQISSYAHLNYGDQLVANGEDLDIAEEEWKNKKLGILQVGYNRTKKGYKLTEVEDKFDKFLAVKKIWAEENEDKTPPQKEYPLKLAL